MRIRFIPLVLLSVAWVASPSLKAGPRDVEWAKVKEAEAQRLPESALALIEPIIVAAQAEGAYPEAIRAIVKKIELERRGEDGNRPREKMIQRLRVETEKAPPEMKPVLTVLIAHLYWRYFQENRWSLSQRTPTTTDNQDLLTWDLLRILKEIDLHFTAALSNESSLQATPIELYSEIIEPGDAPSTYRPTLYDFLAYEALSFYQVGEHGAMIAEENFVVDASSPIFESATDFVAWKPTPPNSGYVPVLRAITLYQRLLAFHSRDKDRSASYDADLARLVYARNVATGEDKEARFKTALERFIQQTSHHEISSRARALLARQLKNEGELLEARALAQKARTAFPESAGATDCAHLILEIEAKSAAVETEHVWTDPWPTIDVTYRNTSRVYFRAVRTDYVTHLKNNRPYDEQSRAKILAEKPKLSWSSSLTPTTDFKERTEKLPVPKTLEPGFYYLVASFSSSFSKNDNQLSITPFWVSKLAMVTETISDERPNRGWVLDSNSGNPISGATVRFFQRSRSSPSAQDTTYVPAGTTTTSETGLF
ncbi:MAG TPA: hypothetical protein PLN52_17915, partial [Opitutaceae bacterium]|nr:hypothetical protein [Opitutaceae bacterium]